MVTSAVKSISAVLLLSFISIREKPEREQKSHFPFTAPAAAADAAVTMAALPASLEEWGNGDETSVSTITSCWCPNCEGWNAKTLLLPTKVPFFREITIVCLTCPDCAFRNTEVSFGGELQEKGVRVELHVTKPSDLNRQVIKSDYATISIPHLELEIPPITQRGQVTTLEGVLKKTADQLSMEQPYRALSDVDVFRKVGVVIDRLRALGNGESDPLTGAAPYPFTIVVDDPSGNSFVENPSAPNADQGAVVTHYERTPTEDMSIGLQPSAQAVADGTIDDANPAHKQATYKETVESGVDDTRLLGREEVMAFPTECPSCRVMAQTNMCVTNIPHFKEVIIMALNCDKCGYKSNEVKGGGAIPSFGTRITLTVNGPDDFGREILKSDTAGLAIPELELELEEGGLDGVYTTVEGILKKLADRLAEANPFGEGDSSTKHHKDNDAEKGAFSGSSMHENYRSFMVRLRTLSKGETFPFTIVLNDPLSNSFVGPVPSDAARLACQAEEEGNTDCYDKYVDLGVEIVEYTRSRDVDEQLGLVDMKTEGYDTTEGQAATAGSYYGTDKMSELSDRLADPRRRGEDHPFDVAKAPVEGDTTKMGKGGVTMAIPSIGARGKQVDSIEDADDARKSKGDYEDVRKAVIAREEADEAFGPCEAFAGSREGFVFKYGAKGIGYYSDKR